MSDAPPSPLKEISNYNEVPMNPRRTLSQGCLELFFIIAISMYYNKRTLKLYL